MVVCPSTRWDIIFETPPLVHLFLKGTPQRKKDL